MAQKNALVVETDSVERHGGGGAVRRVSVGLVGQVLGVDLPAHSPDGVQRSFGLTSPPAESGTTIVLVRGVQKGF